MDREGAQSGLQTRIAATAAQDNAREKFDPIARKVVGTTDQQQSLAVKRLDIREIVGTKLMREITLK